jgi:hypothetical protein
MRRFKEILIAPYYSELTSITDEYIWYENLLSDINCGRVNTENKLEVFDLVDESRKTMRDEFDS